MKKPVKRRGRRPGDPAETREQILDAAREVFLAKGYDTTSMRAVALAAGVDPALVHHYFDSKADLFAESLGAPLRPDRIVSTVLEGPRDQVGTALVTLMLKALDGEREQTLVLGLIRTALGHDFAATMLRQFLVREVFQRIATKLAHDGDSEDAALRATLVASQIVGLILVRYGIRADAAANASIEELAARIGPVVQWHFFGTPLGPGADAR